MGRDALELAHGSLFIEKIKFSFSAADADLLIKAYYFLEEKASDLYSKSLQVAEILLDQGADANTVAAALVVPLLWRGQTEADEIRKHFGQKIITTFGNLEPPFFLRRDAGTHSRQDIHNLLKFFGESLHKAIFIIVFRLVELENALELQKASIRQVAQETLDFYVPIADRLSLGELRRRLEETCFRLMDPGGYEELKQKVAPVQAEDDRCLKILMIGVRRLLDNNGIQGRIQGRTKSLHGIRRKMDQTDRSLEEIMDRIGVRIIVASVPECYTVLGLLHSHFRPIPGTFDDYIGLPKDNGYQSLHTCVYPVREISHKPIEFQVRTELMHKEAEHGTAAHWLYKSGTVSLGKAHNQVQWMEGLVHQHKTTDSTESFIKLLHRQVFRDHLVVFGNGGRIVRLTEKATVRDYLNISNIPFSGDTIIKVNGKLVGLNHPLQDGDSIEIPTNGDLSANPTAGGEWEIGLHGMVPRNSLDEIY
jgi:(p)ppGpp synthase/HD superfamily hydrolase